MRRLACCFFAAAISYACSAADGSASAQTFWLKFRDQVIAGDKSKIAEMVSFPLNVHGVTDDDPILKCDRRCFDDMYSRLINQRLYLPDAGGLQQKTMLSAIAGQKSSGYDGRVERNGFRVHQFEFHWVSGKWLLTDAYLEE